MANKTFTVGITGGSGSGKSFFLKELAAQFKPSELCLISQDHYYKPLDKQFVDEKGVENFDIPGSIDHESFYQDILKIKNGVTVTKQEYTFNKKSATPGVLEFIPAPILIVEGLFIIHFPEIEKELDLSIFIEAKDHLKLTRRIRRDNDERGYDLNDVLYRYQYHVMPVYEKLISPLKEKVDLIVPNNINFKRALDTISVAIKAKLAQMTNGQ